jgi:hypothetical protein
MMRQAVKLFGCAAFLLPVLLADLSCSVNAAAHGGYPMSLGIRADSVYEPLARLVLVYLREGQGMTVEFLRFDGAEEMEQAFTAGKADLLLDLPAAEWGREHCAPAADGRERAERVGDYFRRRRPGSWVSAFAFALPPSPCPPSLVAGPRVAGSLRFPLLRQALERITAGIDGDDLSLLVREGGGTPRGENEAARRILAGKGLL